MSEKKSRIFVVAGLFLGDEGKGTTVEHLIRTTNSKLNIRFNGGPQVPDGRWHCFAQVGAGTLATLVPKQENPVPVITLQSKYMVMNPRTLLNECGYLVKNFQAAPDVETCMKRHIRIDRECFVVSPLHRLVNRILETLRSDRDRYGTTGMGVGNTVTDVFHSHPEKLPRGMEVSKVDDPDGKKIGKLTCIQIKDMEDRDVLFKKIQKLFRYKTDRVSEILRCYRKLRHGKKTDLARKLFNDNYRKVIGLKEIEFREGNLKYAEKLYMDFVNEHTVDSLTKFYTDFAKTYGPVCFVNGNELLKKEIQEGNDLVCEGAQGCLLDRIYGIFPHITKTLCSNDNLLALLQETGMSEGSDYEITFYGALRAYSSRHGHGPLIPCPPSWNEKGCEFQEPHNQTTRWQGAFRSGPFDKVAMKYGIEIFGKVDFISLTCIDRMINYYRKKGREEEDGFPEMSICNGYLIPTNVEGVEQILEENKDRFIFKKREDADGWVLTEIKRAEMERYYKTLDLLKITKWSLPDYKGMDDLEEGLKSKPEMTEDEKKLREVALREIVSRGLCKDGEEELARKTADYIVVCQRALGVRIGILSFGPCYNDKVWVHNIV